MVPVLRRAVLSDGGTRAGPRHLSDEFSRFIRKHGNLTSAWQSVRANSRYSSSPYVKDEAQNFAGDEQRRIRSIGARLQHGTYRFSKSRGVAITKPGKPGAVRPIVISRVEDRIVQRCLLDALTSNPQIKERAFQPNSFGGIPKRGKDERAGVVAAIESVLSCVGNGATHVIVADIEGFFQHIRKSECLKIIREYVADQRFLNAVADGIAVDLDNARALWRHKDEFPYGDIGVAQGNCLSPFLGNLLLSDFDQKMNEGDCNCLRYIDDIIILAPSGPAASAKLKRAKKLLARHGLELSETKTSSAPIQVTTCFEYLGIEFRNRQLMPATKARKSIVTRVEEVAAKSLHAMRSCTDAKLFDANLGVPKTLNRIAGMAKGWAHHYTFCNDRAVVLAVDHKICGVYMEYLARAQEVAKKKTAPIAAALLGYRGATTVPFQPLRWPKLSTSPQ
jgi:RNA-directed DNA polymerase